MLRIPRLCGSLALELAVAAAGAMVLVNTVVLVRSALGLGESQVALALGAFGGGSMAAALLTPRLVAAASERTVMLGGGALMVAGAGLGAFAPSLWALMAVWAVVGFGFALTQTPIGRLLVRSALYAAQFALSHAGWLVAYPVAGWAGADLGLPAAFGLLTTLGAAGLAVAWALWPDPDPDAVPHAHPDLPPDHPHLQGLGPRHVHPPVLDRLHHAWPGGA